MTLQDRIYQWRVDSGCTIKQADLLLKESHDELDRLQEVLRKIVIAAPHIEHNENLDHVRALALEGLRETE